MKWKTIALSLVLGLTFSLLSLNNALAAPLDDPNSIGWSSIRGYNSQEFHQYFNQKKAEGYRVIDIEVDEINGQPSYSAIWQNNTDQRNWASLRDLTDDEFSQRWNEFKDKGYRLIDQESYTLNGRRFYAGVWEENKDNRGWVSYRNVDSDEFGRRFRTYSDQGYRMIDMEAYPSGSNLLYSAIWVKNTEGLNWVENRDMSEATYESKFKSLGDQGYRLLDFESYVRNGQQQYAAIWVKNDGRAWMSRRDLSANQYGNWWKTYADEGYRLVDFEAYSTPQGTRYAGIWRQNGDKLSWAPKNAVDDAIVAYQKQFNLPGISVAIAQNGKLVYTRGFGYADVEQQKIAHSGTVFRLASVSKPITATLAMRLVEQNRLSLNQTTRTYVPELPQFHTHTVEHLLKRRSGIRHYKGTTKNCDVPVPNNPNWRDSSSTQYPTAMAATALFRNDPLLFEPGTKQCYSTHAYTILGAVLEGASNLSYPALVNRELTQGLDLFTLRPEFLNQANPERAKIYNDKDDVDDKNIPVQPDNISWKYPGGGLEASSVDLARFGMKLINNSFISKQTREELWKDILSFSGAQLGAHSHILVDFNQKFVIAVLTNQRLRLGDDAPEQNQAGPGRLAGTLASILEKA